ncbi:MAG: hypothetical protein CVU18_21420 [Betaproteobacteria bacterium HGW-Betaproteobacteria-12]|nr:MAG: hypothetical protein CVU18_21420 [Betaproteobacteria bacterium HGW-Betaproteobacteria-12]
MRLNIAFRMRKVVVIADKIGHHTLFFQDSQGVTNFLGTFRKTFKEQLSKHSKFLKCGVKTIQVCHTINEFKTKKCRTNFHEMSQKHVLDQEVWNYESVIKVAQ